MPSEVVAPTLVGRDAELAKLRELLPRLSSGRGGSVWIDGEPGVGKSALVDAFVSDARAQGVRIFRTTAQRRTEPAELQVLTDIFGTPDHHAEGFRADIAALLNCHSGLTDTLPAAGERVLALLSRECGRSPLAIIIDDLQWADEASLAVWQRLVRSADALPMLLVATCRPLPQRASLDTLRRVLRQYASTVIIDLTRLDSRNVAAMVGAWLGARTGGQLIDVLDQAGGNPRYVRLMVDALAAQGLLRVVDGVAQLVEPAPPSPPSLAAAIGETLGYLSEPSRTLLRAGAVLGPRFALEDLSLVLDQPVPALVSVVQEALAARVLADEGADLSFCHPAVRQALRDELPEPVRARPHARAAKGLADAGASWDRVARHLLAAPQLVNGWALAWLAGLPASALNASPSVAADLFEQALTVVASPDPRRQLFTARLTTVLRLLQRYDHLATLAPYASQGCSERPLAAEIACNVALGLFMADRTEEASAMVASVLDGPDPGGAWRSRARALRAMVLFAEGRRGVGWAEADLAYRDGRRDGDAVTIAWSVGTLLRTTTDGEAVAYLDQALAGLGGDDPETTDARLELLTTRLAYLSRLDRTIQFEVDVSSIAALAERANPRWSSMLHAVAATHNYERGQWDKALHCVELVAAGDAKALREARAVAARIAARRDNHTLAEEHLEAASSYSIGHPRFGQHDLLLVRATLAEASGRFDLALALLTRCLNASEQRPTRDPRQWLPTLVRLALATGDLQTAQAAVDTASDDAAEASADARVELIARICRAMTDNDPAALQTAAEHFDNFHRLPDLAFVLEEAAVRLAGSGDLQGARSASARAVTIYDHLGAAADARRIDARLRRYGIQRSFRVLSQRVLTGWEALTPAERIVAHRVMAGESNPEIAANLFLSKRTVEKHVSHIMTKLKVRRRSDVAGEGTSEVEAATSQGRGG